MAGRVFIVLFAVSAPLHVQAKLALVPLLVDLHQLFHLNLVV